MGSAGSKGKASCGGAPSSASSSPSPSSSSSGTNSGWRRRSKGKSKIFFQWCLGLPSRSRDSDVDEQVKIDGYRKDKFERSDENSACLSSNAELDDWRHVSRAGSSSASNAPGRFLSRFNLIPGNVSFRLSRTSSLGSSRAYPVSSLMDDENGIRQHSGLNWNLGDGLATSQVRTPLQHPEDASGLSSLQGNRSISSPNNASRTCGGNREGTDVNLHSSSVFNDVNSNDNRRIGGREPAERNVSFSRTLSVGRLRDRVLRRSPLFDQTFCPLQQERGVRDAQHQSETPVGGETTSPPPSLSPVPFNSSGSILNVPNHEEETSRSRETRYHDLLENSSNFLERRRRIRSQVRALQRLGSRFENISGHERSCILSGQHRRGRCTCRVNNRDSNTNDDTTARASISRIVMLAEALFEVLDEIHQQSVVLSTRPISSIGSVPAPNEVAESLPVKIYVKSNKLQNGDAAQCYICLVEYEDGDSLRILPCNHEFHKPCIDKWLKDIHRVCPLCRGDICRPDSLTAEN